MKAHEKWAKKRFENGKFKTRTKVQRQTKKTKKRGGEIKDNLKRVNPLA